MTKGLLFWVIMIILAIVGIGAYWGQTPHSYWGMGMSLTSFVLFGLLGWQVFGAAVK